MIKTTSFFILDGVILATLFNMTKTAIILAAVYYLGRLATSYFLSKKSIAPLTQKV